MYQSPRLLVLLRVYGIVQVADAVLFSPVLCVFELFERFLGVEAPRAKVSPGGCQPLPS